ncbi:GH92 family glycosyl hydrolase [Ornithobacterium rhinotracheale]|uniref:GH92 family glycosyl hydrolase n=1 Tax=Ornithobacterium rhinotracheale TaxID=28251 RepID=UPI003FA41BD3
MRIRHTILALAGLLFFTHCEKKTTSTEEENAEKLDLVQYVDPFIGTGEHGHTYPGATMPFGMLQVSPINGVSAWDWCSGYHYSDSIIIGFGHLTLSGTGIGDLNDVKLMPASITVDLAQLSVGKDKQYPEKSTALRDMLPYKSRYSHSNETATPGYYQVFLEDPKINVELTTAKRVAFHRYTYADGAEQSVVFNPGFAINWDDPTHMRLTQKDENTLIGERFSTGWAKNQKVFFAIRFNKPITEFKTHMQGENITSAQAFFNNENKELLVKVALSSVSTDNALQNMATEGEGFPFDEIRDKAKLAWNEALESINVESDNKDLKTIFYTALYHTKVAPVTFSDANGDFRLENDSIVKKANYTAYSTFSLWDTFRTEHPLLTITNSDKVADMINSVLAYYQVHKLLPVWTLYGNETNTMTGYHSVAVIAEAYLKGVRGFNAEEAYQAMKATMMSDARGLDLYKKYGYVPYDKLDESVTITLEYAYDDWCLAQMAKKLGKEEDYKYFLNRSMAYKKLFDPSVEFMRGKSAVGQWNPVFDPKHSNHREHTDYTEGNAWQHSWFVPQDVNGFIALFPSKEAFTNKLENLFTESSEITGDNVSADISGLIGQYAHGNEPSHHIAYLFNKAGQPWRTQYWVNHILKTQYNTTPEGYSGNEDCGQMSAWYVMSAIGLYPMNPASTEYEITSPMFAKTTMKVGQGKTFVIEAKNFSEKNIYIQKATLNGKPLQGTSISHEQIMQGGTLVLELGAEPNKSGTLN